MKTAHQPKRQAGFSLLELMIAMFIMIILISVAIPTYQLTVQHARETVLKENLWQMRRAIDQYSSDKGKLPQSIDDLVKGKYLREMPIDPITEKSDWTEVKSDDRSDGQQQERNEGRKKHVRRQRFRRQGLLRLLVHNIRN